MGFQEEAVEFDSEHIDLTLLANFTHQVINPLNGVVGTLDNILDGTIGPNRREQRTRAARAQLENCITLIRNLAYLASGEDAFSVSGERKIVLPQVIIESAMFYQEEGTRRNVSIDLLNREDQNMIKGHPEILRQCLMNIFDNCVKYSRVGSAVSVSQRIQKKINDAIIEISNLSEAILSNEDIEKMFNVGYRGSNARDIIASGTGLGLFICRELIEKRHGGTISAQRDGQGLLFTIKIPDAWS